MKIRISKKASKGLREIRKNARENTYKFIEELKKNIPLRKVGRLKRLEKMNTGRISITGIELDMLF